MGAAVDFRILGPLEAVAVEGRPGADDRRVLDLGRPKQRAVLAALVTEPNRVVSFDRLVDQLWGDEPPAQAAASLQSYISNLRRVLEPGGAPRRRAGVLVTTPPGYMLVVDRERIDAARFERLVDEGSRMLEAGRPLDARQTLTEALGLWRGPALGELASDPLFRPEAVRLEELRWVALERRTDADLALGRHAEVVAEVEHWVARWPLRERLWQQLMLALYRSGRQGEALRAFQACRRVLADDLGIDPSPALRQLERDMLAHAPSLDWAPPAAAPAPVVVAEPGDGPVDEAPRHGRVALVGRRSELAALEAVVADAGRGGGRVALVAGDAGIGKTRLLLELADRAEAGGADVVWGRCYEGEGAPAFWPWAEVLRGVLGPLAGGERDALVAAHPALAPLVPEWSPARMAPESAGAARLPLFQSVVELLTERAARRPLVVLVDDLHWADLASLALLEFFVERLGRSPVALVCAFRDFEAHGDHPLVATLGALARHPWIERLRLPGLDVPGVAQYIAEVSGLVPDEAVTAAVWARTEGNPFFVGELVRLLAAEGTLVGRGPADVLRAGVPEGVRDVVRRRLGRLTPAANAVLSVASVVGRTFGLAVVERVAGTDSETALDAVELALVAGLVEEAGGDVGRHSFTHELVRETLYEGLSGLRRARLHGQVAAALQELEPAKTAPEDVANHAWHARSVLGAAAVLPHVWTAVESAVSRYAWEQAAELLRRFVDLLVEVPPSPERDRRELEAQMLLGSIWANVQGPRHPEVHAAFLRAGELSARLGTGAHTFPVLLTGALTPVSQGDWPRGRALAEQFLEAGRRSGDGSFLAAGHLGVGMALYVAGQFEAARSHLEQGLALAPPEEGGAGLRPGPPVLMYRCSLMIVLAILGEAHAASELRGPIEEVAASSGNLMDQGMAAGHLAWLATLQGDVAATEQAVTRALEVCGKGVFTPLEAVVRTMEGWCLSRRGRAGEGLLSARAGLSMQRSCGMRAGVTLFECLTADVERGAGLDVEALARVDAALADVEVTGERAWESLLHQLRGEILLATGHACRRDAIAALQQAVSVAEAQGARLFADRAAAVLSGVPQV